MGAVARLADLGLDRATIAASLRGCVAQRLVRRVCAECSQPIVAMTDDEERLSESFGVTPATRATGCKACGTTGFRGRIPVNEVAVVTPAIAEMISAGATTLQLQRAAVGGGMRTLQEVALERVVAGDTTLREVERVIGEAHDPTVANEANGAGTETPENTQPPRRFSGPMGMPKVGLSRVLVVDDDPMVRLLATTALSAGGFTTESVEDGDIAFKKVLAEKTWDLVVTDLHMARMNGGELLQALRATEETARIPVIVLTGSSGQETEVEIMDAGADDYLSKPIDPPRLVARVKAALRRSAL
jgi:CheY-like chemotaxis protein